VDCEIGLLRKFGSKQAERFAHLPARQDKFRKKASAAGIAFENKIAAALLNGRVEGASIAVFPEAVIGENSPDTLFHCLAESEDSGFVHPSFIITAQNGGEFPDEAGAIPEAI
jgi:hypothetical protein